jgi:hypothetical protein
MHEAPPGLGSPQTPVAPFWDGKQVRPARQLVVFCVIGSVPHAWPGPASTAHTPVYENRFTPCAVGSGGRIEVHDAPPEHSFRVSDFASKPHVPSLPITVFAQTPLVFGRHMLQRAVGRPGETRLDACDFFRRERARAAFEERPLVLDLAPEFFHPEFLDQDLDPRLVLVVAPPVAVVHAQHRVEIGQQMLCGKEGADLVADDRRAAQTATDDHGKAGPAVIVEQGLQADVVHHHRRTVGG